MNAKKGNAIPYERLVEIDKSSYDSTEGNILFDHFNEEPFLKSILFDTTLMANTIDECIQFCLKQTQLESLIFYTEESSNFHYTDTNTPPLIHLKFLCVASKFDVKNTQDYILPFLNSAPNLERIFYANGSLSKRSIQKLRDMANRNLCFMYLDTVHIQDRKFFHEASKKFDKMFWLLRQRYISSEKRKPNSIISAWNRIFHTRTHTK